MKKIMICHAPEDLKHAESMKKMMIMQKRQGLIEYIEDAAACDIGCVLVSSSFFAHERAWAESEILRRRNLAGACRLIPILVEPVPALPDHMAMLVTLPRHGKAVKNEEDWANIAGEMRAIAMIGSI